MAERVLVRCSSTPTWLDCRRRWAATALPGFLARLGYNLNTRQQTIGAAVGRAVHAGAAEEMTAKLQAKKGSPLDAAIADFDTSLGEAATLWDATTKDRNGGQLQILRMTKAFVQLSAPDLDPIAVEERLEANFGDHLHVSGKKDMLVREPNRIVDLKTGKRRQNLSQYGNYSLLERTHGRQTEEVAEVHIPRVAVKEDQPPPIIYATLAAVAEQAAETALLEMDVAIGRFQHAVETGLEPPERAFPANPMSVLCGAKWCPAHGTKWCREHL